MPTRSERLPPSHVHSSQNCSSTFENFAERLTALLRESNYPAALQLISDCRDARIDWQYMAFQGKADWGHQQAINSVENLLNVIVLLGERSAFNKPLKVVAGIVPSSGNKKGFAVYATYPGKPDALVGRAFGDKRDSYIVTIAEGFERPIPPPTYVTFEQALDKIRDIARRVLPASSSRVGGKSRRRRTHKKRKTLGRRKTRYSRY